jgi:hypothetical protein
MDLPECSHDEKGELEYLEAYGMDSRSTTSPWFPQW